MSETVLDELERLEREATKGPWRTVGNEVRCDEIEHRRLGADRASCLFQHDAALIAALRNAAPDLIRLARVAEFFVSCHGDRAKEILGLAPIEKALAGVLKEVS